MSEATAQTAQHEGDQDPPPTMPENGLCSERCLYYLKRFLRSEGCNVEGGSQIAATMLELYHDKVIKSNKAGPAGRPESKTKVKSNKSRTVKRKYRRK